MPLPVFQGNSTPGVSLFRVFILNWSNLNFSSRFTFLLFLQFQGIDPQLKQMGFSHLPLLSFSPSGFSFWLLPESDLSSFHVLSDINHVISLYFKVLSSKEIDNLWPIVLPSWRFCRLKSPHELWHNSGYGFTSNTSIYLYIKNVVFGLWNKLTTRSCYCGDN
jgi:hypothetical protein